MHDCRVKLSIPGKGDVKWIWGYDDATDVDIKGLIVEVGFVLASLEDELSRRLGRETEKVRDNLAHLTVCEKNLKTCAERIQNEGLSYDDLKQFTNQPTNEIESEAQTDQLDQSVKVIKVGLGHMLSKSRGSWTGDAYNELIWLVSTVIGPVHALLLKCSLSKNKAKALNLARKAKLVQHINKKKVEFTCEAIHNEAVKLGLYNHDLQPASRKRKIDEVLSDRDILGRRTCTKDAAINSNSISTISSSKSVSAISSHTVSPSSQGDADSPLGNLVSSPDDSLLTTSSSQHHTLISPSTVEISQVPSMRRVFDCIQTDHPSDSDYLLLLFHLLGGCEIPYALFERTRSQQYRWTNDGDQTQITALEAGLDQQLVDLLSDETRLAQAIHKLEPFIKLNTSIKGSWICSIDNSLEVKLCKRTREEWAIKCLRWICFVFPRDQFPSDPDEFLSVGKRLLPLLNLALGQVIQRSLPTYVRDDAAETLLAASRIGDMPSRQSAITLATEILGDQPPKHLQVALARQKSTLLRIVADWKQSEHVIHRVSHSPSPPQVLLVSENLFHNIKVYFENCCQNMILDDHGTLFQNGAEFHNDLCNDFDSYCFTATMLMQKGLHAEFRRALSKASALVEQILRAEHPRTLACFLEVFIHLIQIGLPEVTSFLRGFIKGMSAKVTSKGHPWGQICQLLGELDSESLDQAMAQIWKCTTDTFDSELGTLTPLAVSVRLDYIKRVYGSTDYLEEERHLRGLLAQFGDIPRLRTPRVLLNLAHNLNKQGSHAKAEKMAWEVLSLLQKYEIYTRRIVERIESLKIVSRSQFNQGKTQEAEQTMREAIRMIVDQWGIQHSWVPEFMNVLEGWLRGWGREEDANTLRGEIEELMGKDEIDEQLDGVQGLLC